MDGVFGQKTKKANGGYGKKRRQGGLIIRQARAVSNRGSKGKGGKKRKRSQGKV